MFRPTGLWTGASKRIAVTFAVCFLHAAVASAQLIISEFRLRGPNGANDEFVEIYNNSGASHTVAGGGTGYALAASNGVARCIVPNGTIIPERGHYLCVNSVGYSLASYPAGNGTTATGDATYTTDIPDNAGLALFNTSVAADFTLANRLDAVGSTSEANTLYKEGVGYPALTPFSIDYAFTRRLPGGCTGSSGGSCNSVALIQTTPGPLSNPVQDTNNNAVDFLFVDTNGTSAGAGQRLGAPGPESTTSPIASDDFALTVSTLDSCRLPNASPNYVRAGGAYCGPPNTIVFPCVPALNSTFGTLDIRQTFTNETAADITRLRFRVVDITTFPSISGVADLRPITSSDIAVTVDRPVCGTGTSSVTVRGTTLEVPPSQPNGSGFNGSLSVGAITAGTPLGPGQSVNVRFVLGVQQMGAARFCVAAETGAAPAATARVFCFIGPTEGTIRQSSQTFSNASAITINADGPAAPYPSGITVSGFTTPVTKVTVTLKQMTHTFPADVDVLLVSPTGQHFILMSDVVGDFDFTSRTYTFDDYAAALLPSNGTPPASGTFRPTNYGAAEVFPAPASAGPYLNPAPAGSATLAAAFNGLDPNGTWFLYVNDDAVGDSGTIAGGWDLTLSSSCTAPLGAVTSDFNGDCVGDITVFRPSTGQWFMRNLGAVQFGDPSDIPVAGDYNADGVEDVAVFRPSTGTWFVRNQFTAQFGDPGDVPVPGDFDGDGATDVAVYRPSTGDWFVRNQFSVNFGGAGGYVPVVGDYNGDGIDDVAVFQRSTGMWFVRNQLALHFGDPGDRPVQGDYNGDGKTDIAVYRPATRQWFVRNLLAVQFGDPGDIPVPRDYDGNGSVDVAIYRPSTHQWFIKDQGAVSFGDGQDIPLPLTSGIPTAIAGDYNGDGATDIAVHRPSTRQWFVRNQLAVQFGDPGDVPIPADYNGDRRMDIAVYRPSTGHWFVRNQPTVQFGDPSDKPVPGDYNGDGTMDVAVYRPSTGTWFVRNQFSVSFGDPNDIPVPGDYNGDGLTDIAVYRPTSGQWFVRNQLALQFGDPGDMPVPADYNGDGKMDLAVYRFSTGQWFVRNQFNVQFGDSGDVPVPGDYNGDRFTDVAIYRPSTGQWFVRNLLTVSFGDSTYVPMVRIGPPQ